MWLSPMEDGTGSPLTWLNKCPHLSCSLNTVTLEKVCPTPQNKRPTAQLESSTFPLNKRSLISLRSFSMSDQGTMPMIARFMHLEVDIQAYLLSGSDRSTLTM